MITGVGLGLPEIEGSGFFSLHSYQAAGLHVRKASVNARDWVFSLISKSGGSSFFFFKGIESQFNNWVLGTGIGLSSQKLSLRSGVQQERERQVSMVWGDSMEGWRRAVAVSPVEKHLGRDSSRITCCWCPAATIREYRQWQRRSYQERTQAEGKSVNENQDENVLLQCNTWLLLQASTSNSASVRLVSALWLALSRPRGRPGGWSRQLPACWSCRGGGMGWPIQAQFGWLNKGCGLDKWNSQCHRNLDL